MKIEDIFSKDINRPIDGVVKVDAKAEKLIEQEVQEYVVTRELKSHFMTLFNNYTNESIISHGEIGVWISGFFGSGKSHFLKMLSYLLSNKEVGGKKTVEWFREKFRDDPASFMSIDNATRGKTDTILFNIDVEGQQKDAQAILRVFTKMFYEFLGYWGENLKTAKLEQFLDNEGKYEEFKTIFKRIDKKDWELQRDSFAFLEDEIVQTLQELGWSEKAARNWFSNDTPVELSVSQLVKEIQEYISTKPKDYRLLFMIDEVGQYIGSDTNLLLNLQSIIEELGSKCNGQVWVFCTGQEALDEIVKVRTDEFSRILARFKTILSLSSSSVDEVVKKRILDKKDSVKADLRLVYESNAPALKNLFYFSSDTLRDVQGFRSDEEFVEAFPFIPYQFTLLPKVYEQIRRHGHAGTHQSKGERSMLSGFQEAAQKVKNKNELTLVPFYHFYDSIQSFLDTTVRGVVNRCSKAAENRDGIEPQDIDVLKLLYLLRYINEDVKATLNNLIIFMADSIDVDKIALRERVSTSLERLYNQNYVGRTGEVYHFLTDEEQDVQKEISKVLVDTSLITKKIAEMIFGDIYDSRKFKYGEYDFGFDQYVDSLQYFSATNSDIALQFLTVATDQSQKDGDYLEVNSKQRAIVVLPENTSEKTSGSQAIYYEKISKILKVDIYTRTNNLAQFSSSKRKIVEQWQDEASYLGGEVLDDLRNAIAHATYYVDGELLDVNTSNAKEAINEALGFLVGRVYNALKLITHHVQSDTEIAKILLGSGKDDVFGGMEANAEAKAAVEKWLTSRENSNYQTFMSDVQTNFQKARYGWKEIDIAAVVAALIADQKVTITYAGETILPGNAKLPDMLRKKSEIAKTAISIRKKVDVVILRKVTKILSDYFDCMDIPTDEDSLVQFINDRFTQQTEEYQELINRFNNGSANYPNKHYVAEALLTIGKITSQKSNNGALFNQIVSIQDELFDSKEDVQEVQSFFVNQQKFFDEAIHLCGQMNPERSYFEQQPEITNALNKMQDITRIPAGNERYSYRRIPELQGLINTVEKQYDALLARKRDELRKLKEECLSQYHTIAGSEPDVKPIVTRYDDKYCETLHNIEQTKSLRSLDGYKPEMMEWKDEAMEAIESALHSSTSEPAKQPTVPRGNSTQPTQSPKQVENVYRQMIFKVRRLTSPADIDRYVDEVRTALLDKLRNCDEIQIR